MTDIKHRAKLRRILWIETLGFLTIITLTWLDEMMQLPVRIFGGVAFPNWRESALETLIALAVWLVVFISTKKLLEHLYYLEDFLRLCAWCRRVGDNGAWVSFEDFFASRLDTQTSHGICPDCAAKFNQKADNLRRTRGAL